MIHHFDFLFHHGFKLKRGNGHNLTIEYLSTLLEFQKFPLFRQKYGGISEIRVYLTAIVFKSDVGIGLYCI